MNRSILILSLFKENIFESYKYMTQQYFPWKDSKPKSSLLLIQPLSIINLLCLNLETGVDFVSRLQNILCIKIV